MDPASLLAILSGAGPWGVLAAVFFYLYLSSKKEVRDLHAQMLEREDKCEREKAELASEFKETTSQLERVVDTQKEAVDLLVSLASKGRK